MPTTEVLDKTALVKVESEKKRNLSFNIEIKSLNEDDFTIDGVFSTSEIDRHGEVVVQSEWQLSEYLQNPVVLFGHNHDKVAVGKMLSLGFENGNLVGKIKFAVNENPEAKVLFDLYKGGYMRAFSVGFTADPIFDEATQTILLHNPLLYEVSLVNVPANAMALAKSKGVNVTALEKEGRVLSKKNRDHVEKAKVALDELLAADEASRNNQIILSTDKAVENKKVETPNKAGAGASIVAQKANRILNNAIRLLLEAKR